MKTLKIIVFAAIALFGMAACSDEKKALNYVSEEVVPDSELNDFLIRYKLAMFKDDFEPELRYCLSSIIRYSYLHSFHGLSQVDLMKEFIPEGRDCTWKHHKPGNSYDSDMMLNSILQLVSEKLDIILVDTTTNFTDYTSNGMSKEQLFNYILSKSVYWNHYLTNDEIDSIQNQLGIENTLGSSTLIRYEWYVMGVRNEQSAFIDEVVNWIVSNCRDEVMSKIYKLVDKQSITVGENQYKVTYLLEPQLEINFSVKKIGKTFVCENYSIEGNVFNL
ncbi:MAG: hypothetical protein K6D59_10540 [Bacteroidales bacterium]|nr:hypothetical protein [Bacteroidales bacterium]